MLTLKTPEEIEVMAEGGRKLALVLSALKEAATVGVTTLALDQLAYRLIVEQKAKPAFLGYRPAGARKAYPFTLCASVNDVVVHGQPSLEKLADGDVVKLDLGLRYKGLCLDAAITVGVGAISKEAKHLITTTKEALDAGIKEARPGRTLGDVGYAIQKVITKNKLAVVEGLTGHGIGRDLHEDPPVFNFGRRDEGDPIELGMVLAIEPMVSTGRGAIRQLKDESYGTADGSLAAQIEHTVAITMDGPRILTKL